MHSRLITYALMLVMLAFLWAGSAFAATSPAPGAAMALPTGEPVFGPVTVTVTASVTLPSSGEGVQALFLAGLGADPSGPPKALSLVWAEQESGWFPVWGLQLHSDQGLLIQSQTVRPAPSRHYGTQHANILSAPPLWGHTYETTFSYYPHTGGLSITVFNLTSGEQVFRSHFLVAPTTKALYPGAGIVAAGAGAASERFLPQEDVSALPVFVPSALRWGPVAVREGVPDSVPTTQLQRDRIDGVALRFEIPGGAPGTFHVNLEHDGDRRVLIESQATEGSVYVPISMDSLPVGRSRLILEYRDGGSVWFTDARDLTFGEVRAQVSLLDFHQERREATAVVTLQADGDLPVMQITVTAALLQMEWNVETGRYVDVPWETRTLYQGRVALSREPIEIPVRIADPTGHPALWKVKFSVATEIQTTLVAAGTERLMGTFVPPQLDAASFAPLSAAVSQATQ